MILVSTVHHLTFTHHTVLTHQHILEYTQYRICGTLHPSSSRYFTMPRTVLPPGLHDCSVFSVNGVRSHYEECHISELSYLTLAARLNGPHLFLQVGQRFCCNGFEDWADAAAKDDRREEEEEEEEERPPWAGFTGGPSSHSIIPVAEKGGQ